MKKIYNAKSIIKYLTIMKGKRKKAAVKMEKKDIGESMKILEYKKRKKEKGKRATESK